jgi:hypothetical protein
MMYSTIDKIAKIVGRQSPLNLSPPDSDFMGGSTKMMSINPHSSVKVVVAVWGVPRAAISGF